MPKRSLILALVKNEVSRLPKRPSTTEKLPLAPLAVALVALSVMIFTTPATASAPYKAAAGPKTTSTCLAW